MVKNSSNTKIQTRVPWRRPRCRWWAGGSRAPCCTSWLADRRRTAGTALAPIRPTPAAPGRLRGACCAEKVLDVVVLSWRNCRSFPANYSIFLRVSTCRYFATHGNLDLQGFQEGARELVAAHLARSTELAQRRVLQPLVLNFQRVRGHVRRLASAHDTTTVSWNYRWIGSGF